MCFGGGGSTTPVQPPAAKPMKEPKFKDPTQQFQDTRGTVMLYKDGEPAKGSKVVGLDK
jgi:hypothetical protein